jgi:transposase
VPRVYDNKVFIPLDLEGIRIVRYEIDERGDYYLYAESTATSERCHKCGQIVTYKHGVDEPIKVRHLDILDHRVFIIVSPMRFRCFNCDNNPTTTQRFPWRIGKSPYTTDFERHMGC